MFHLASCPAVHALTLTSQTVVPSHTTPTPQVAGSAPIRSAEACDAAAQFLGYTFAAVFESAGDHEYCLYADDGRNMVYFNKAPKALEAAPRNTYKSVCQSVNNVPGKSADLTKVPLLPSETIEMLTAKKTELLNLEKTRSLTHVKDEQLVSKCSAADQPSRVKGSKTCKQLFGPDWACCKDMKMWEQGDEPSQHTRCSTYWEKKDAKELNFQGDGVSKIHECAFVGFQYVTKIQLTSNPDLTMLDGQMFRAVAPQLRNLYVKERSERTF